jgi:hypothetical protein
MIRSGLKIVSLLVLLLALSSLSSFTAPPKKDIYQVRIYRVKSDEQVSRVDSFLRDALLPALHRTGLKKIGVFKPLANDTAVIKSVYVLIPFSSIEEFTRLEGKLQKDEVYNTSAKNFTDAASDHAPFERMESILLEAFNGQKHLVLPEKKPGNLFELRSYESPTEHLHHKKVDMFENEEISLFKKLDFRTVFYARVISGSRMPNFMYMPSFTSMDEKNAHWKTFGNDPEWKRMSSDPVNENKVSVSHIDSILMLATDYSDI